MGEMVLLVLRELVRFLLHRAAPAVAGSLVVAGVPTLSAAAVTTGPCDPPVNAIVCENSKPGNPQSDWRVDGYYGDIMGYGTATSVQPGGTLPFKVKSSASAYHIEIYRLGWYGGLGGRLISKVAPSVRLPQNQPACLTDGSSGLVDCGNWAVSATWTVPTDAVSGYYVANFIRDDGTAGASQFPFIVRNDASTSALVVQASDETWQAYNNYGGNNLYNGTFAGSSDGRAYKVSYNRPYQNSGTANFMNAELPMLRWLERNGYDVSYISGVDTAQNAAILRNHKTFISSGHDEYWAGVQRTNVEQARDAGVNLAFFSGNEMFWKTRFEPSISSDATAYRTLVCYKETKAGAKIDPSPEWTGTWRDPRLSPPSDGGRPENGVTGTLFTVNGYADDTMTVSSQYSALRFWRNTSVASLQPGATASFIQGSLGYEWDTDADNPVRPAGAIDLSQTTVTHTDGLVLQDYGNTYGNGTVSHSLVLYRVASGALVFGAGTVQWAWGLDDLHLYPNPAGGTSPGTDVRMQQATVNLLADMGAQPATLQSGLVPATQSTDTTGPTTTIGAPSAGSTVPAGSQQTVTGTAQDVGGVVAGVQVSVDGGATYHEATPTGPNGSWSAWSYSWTPTAQGPLTVSARATDDSANLGAVASAAVTVGPEQCPCTIFGGQTPTKVDSGDTGTVELGTRFTTAAAGQVTAVRFYKSVANTGTHTGSVWSSAGQLLGTGTFTNETASGWQTLTLATPVPVIAGGTYVVSYKTTTGHYSADASFFTGKGAGITPLTAPASTTSAPNGVFVYGGGFPTGSYQDTNYWVDVVLSADASAPDTTPPAVAAASPADGATGTSVGATTTATFSEPISASGLRFSLTAPDGSVVPGASSVSADGLTATFVPSASLSASTAYTASVTATDLSGNTMPSPFTWSFTTGTSATTGAGTATVFGARTPTNVDANDGKAVELGMRVTPSISGAIVGVRFYKSANNTGTHTGSLWTSSGRQLASGTFAGETTSGWQTLTFTTPVAVTAGQTYVVSYHTSTGHYSADQGFFTGTGAGTAPLTAPASTSSAGNGVYVYGSGGFPTSTYKDTNYWVDAILDTTSAGPDTTPPAVSSTTPLSGATGVPLTGAVSAVMSEPVSAGGLTFTLTPAGGSPVAGSASVSADGTTVTFRPAAALAGSTSYSASLQASDLAGNAMATPTTWSFTTAAPPDTTPPTVTAVSPSDGATGVRTTDSLTVSFSEPVSSAGLLFTLSGPGGTTVPGVPVLASDGRSAVFTPSAALATGTPYTASVTATDLAGNAMPAAYTWSYTTATAPDTTAPAVTATSPSAGGTGVAPGAALTATFSEPVSATGLRFALTDPKGAAVAGTVTVSSDGLSATFTPSAPLVVSATYAAQVSASDRSGNAMPAATAWSFTTAAAACPCTVLGDAQPTTVDSGDRNGVELGMRVVPRVNAVVTGVRFYKSTANTGTHTGSLWSSTGQLLASGTFTAESASGWQTLTFATPVQVAAGVTYVVSYFAPSGHYSADTGFFTGGSVQTSVLSAPASTAGAGNGVYVYGGGFPTSTHSDTNYYVDVVATTDGADTTPPSVTAQQPAAGATAVPVSQVVSATLSEPVTSTGLGLSVTGPGGAVVNGATVLSSDGRTVTFTPSADLAVATTYSVTVRATDLMGNTMPAQTWSFTTTSTAPVACPCSLFRASDTPAKAANDGKQVSLGMTWSPSVNGTVTAIRFYKVTGDTGTHTGTVFTAGGAVLGTGTFTGESASGWQTLTLATPVTVTAGTSYVVAFSSSLGRYGYTTSYFATPHTAGPLTAPANSSTVANGRYTYASGSAFPVSSGNGSNYYVDVVFSAS